MRRGFIERNSIDVCVEKLLSAFSSRNIGEIATASHQYAVRGGRSILRHGSYKSTTYSLSAKSRQRARRSKRDGVETAGGNIVAGEQTQGYQCCQQEKEESFLHLHLPLLIAMVEEVDSLKFLAELSLFFRGDVLEWGAVGTKVEPYQLHDTLAPHDVASEVADDVDDVLGVVLKGAGFLQIALLPCFENAGEAASVVVRRATDAALCATHSQTGQNGFVLTVEHVELAVLIATATIVLVEALEGVFDTCKIGDAAIHRLKEVVHGKESAVEGWDVVEIKRQAGSAIGNLLAVFYQFLDASHLGEGRRHRTDTEGSYRLSMLSQSPGRTDAGAAHVDDDLEVGEIFSGIHPCFGYLHTLFLCKHIAFTTGAIDEYAFQTIALQHGSIFGNDGKIDAAIGKHRGKGGVDEPFDFLHVYPFCEICFTFYLFMYRCKGMNLSCICQQIYGFYLPISGEADKKAVLYIYAGDAVRMDVLQTPVFQCVKYAFPKVQLLACKS